MDGMKRILCLTVCTLMVLGATACSAPAEHDAIIRDAKALVVEAWTKSYENSPETSDKTVQFRNTRVIEFTENSDPHLSDIACIVEFLLYTDPYASAPYYPQSAQNDCVLIYRDGTMEVASGYLRAYFSANFAYPTDEIAQVIDYEGRYNSTERCP